MSVLPSADLSQEPLQRGQGRDGQDVDATHQRSKLYAAAAIFTLYPPTAARTSYRSAMLIAYLRPRSNSSQVVAQRPLPAAGDPDRQRQGHGWPDAGLKFSEAFSLKAGELGAEIEFQRAIPVVQSYGLGQSQPQWQYQAHAAYPLLGDRFVYPGGGCCGECRRPAPDCRTGCHGETSSALYGWARRRSPCPHQPHHPVGRTRVCASDEETEFLGENSVSGRTMTELSLRFTSDHENDPDGPIHVAAVRDLAAGTYTDLQPFTPPLSDQQLGDLRWYLEVYSTWPTGPDYIRAERIESEARHGAKARAGAFWTKTRSASGSSLSIATATCR